MSTNGTSTTTTTATDPAKPVIAVPLNFTKYTAWFGGAASAIAAALVAVLPQFKDVPIPVEVAMIGVIGAGFIAVAIAAGADVLGRSYVTANPPPTTPAAAPPPSTPPAMLALPTPLPVTISGSGSGSAVAVAARYKSDGTLEYLVGSPAGNLEWKTGEAVSLGTQPAPAHVIPPSPVPLKVSGTKRVALAVRVGDDGSAQIYAPANGGGLEWEDVTDKPIELG
jgi:hypothetical protein